MAAIEAKKASGEWEREMAAYGSARVAEAERKARFQAFLDSGAPVDDWEE